MRAIGPAASELADAAAAYDRALPPGRRFSFDIRNLDALGLSVMVEGFTGEPIGTKDGFGYGADREEARVGALGELTEMIHLTSALADDPGERASYAEMAARHGGERVIDPLTLCLPAGSRYTSNTTLDWVRVKRWPDGEAFVPREFVAISGLSHRLGRSDPLPPLTTPITNGLGAGLSPQQALAHGVLELFQRDGNCVRFRAMDRGTVVDIDGVGEPGIVALLEHLRAYGIAPLVKLASTEFGLSNLYVVDEGDGEPWFPLQVTACGEAAHANALRALRKALLEFMAARCRKAMMHGPPERIDAIAPPGYMPTALGALSLDNEEPRALSEMAAWLALPSDRLRAMLRPTVLSKRARVPFAELPTVADEAVRDPASRLDDLAGRLASAGLELFYYDATPREGPPHVVKAIVPGLECETMSYHRIGERGVARLLAERSPLAGLGPPPEGTAPVRLTDDAQQRLGGPAYLATDRIDEIVGTLYPLYREPSAHAVQLHIRSGTAVSG